MRPEGHQNNFDPKPVFAVGSPNKSLVQTRPDKPEKGCRGDVGALGFHLITGRPLRECVVPPKSLY